MPVYLFNKRLKRSDLLPPERVSSICTMRLQHMIFVPTYRYDPSYNWAKDKKQ